MNIRCNCTPALVGLILLVDTLSTRADVVINEIHYDPDDETIPEEFIELFNYGGTAVDVSGWFFSSGVTWVFPEGTEIESGGYLVIAQDPPTLADTLSFDGAFGPYQGKLANGGERLVLRSSDGRLVDEVNYGVGFPWPSASKGKGSSLELLHPSLDNDLGGSWRASGFLDVALGERIDFIRAEDTAWRYRKGTSEPSTPRSAWREPDFIEDATWLTGQTSIGFGDGDDNTVLDDMQNSYSSVYLRREFDVDGEIPPVLQLGIYVDDGTVVWINGVEVFRGWVDDGDLPFDGIANNHEADWFTANLPPPATYLVPGRNVIAVHALNTRLGSSDFSIDAALYVPGAGDGIDAVVAPPTPGAPNSVFTEETPPQLRQVEHFPFRPTSGEAVGVSVKATDPDGVVSVTLEYQVVDPGGYVRLSDAGYDDGWTELEMNDTGDGIDQLAGDDIYTALLPADVQEHRRLVRYRIRAVDENGLSVEAPHIDDPQPNFAYFVYDGTPGWRGASRPGVTPVQVFSPEVMSSLPVYHLIARESDVINCQYNSAYRNTHFLGTLVYEGHVYDHIEFEIRGEFSTYVSGKNKWRLFFPTGHEFRARDNFGKRYRTRWKTMNFSAAATPWVPTNRGMAALGEGVAFRSYALAGVPSPNVNFFEFRIIDETVEAHPSDQYRGDLWGLYMTIEHTDGRFLDERDLPDGNTYKIEGGNGDKRNQGPTQSRDSSDYVALRNGYNRAQPISWWRANVNLPVYYSFRAVNRAINNHDLREGWNIAQYHDPVTDLWSVIPWDLDMLYMPVTHWSGVMNFQNALSQHAVFLMEYRNRARELQDLLFSSDQFAQLVDELAAVENPPGEPLTQVDVDEAMWNYHPRTAGSHRGAFYRNPSTHTARGGTITRTLVSADHEGMARWIKDFVQRGYGADQLEVHARDTSIPNWPRVTYVGEEDFPVDGLVFRSTPFGDPNGDDTFGAMKWRIAEVTPPGAPPFDPENPRPFEVNATWESEELTVFEEEMVIPPDVVKIGPRYRVRVRWMDDTGRWSHWSPPVQLTTSEPTVPFPQQNELRITELMYHPVDPDLEFIELRNIGGSLLDLTAVSLIEGVEFRFADGDISDLGPGEYVLVLKNRAVFEATYDTADLLIAGEFSGRLSNAGEQVLLALGPNAPILDFTYLDEWYPLTDGAGFSLHIIDDLAPPESWSDPASWRESSEDGGSPGRGDGPPPTGGRQLPGDGNQDGVLDISDAISLLRFLFLGGGMEMPCDDGDPGGDGNRALLDVNAQGGVGIDDAIHVLDYIFLDGPAPAAGTRCLRIDGCPDACGL